VKESVRHRHFELFISLTTNTYPLSQRLNRLGRYTTAFATTYFLCSNQRLLQEAIVWDAAYKCQQGVEFLRNNNRYDHNALLAYPGE